MQNFQGQDTCGPLWFILLACVKCMIDDPSVCLSVMWMGYAKIAEWIDVLFGMETRLPGIQETLYVIRCRSPSVTVRGRGFDVASAKLQIVHCIV